jgi:hypothetical protein
MPTNFTKVIKVKAWNSFQCYRLIKIRILRRSEYIINQNFTPFRLRIINHIYVNKFCAYISGISKAKSHNSSDYCALND